MQLNLVYVMPNCQNFRSPSNAGPNTDMQVFLKLEQTFKRQKNLLIKNNKNVPKVKAATIKYYLL